MAWLSDAAPGFRSFPQVNLFPRSENEIDL